VFYCFSMVGAGRVQADDLAFSTDTV